MTISPVGCVRTRTLPVSTPPNAIVFGTGCVPLLKMVKYGIVLDVIGIVAIIVVVHWLVPLLLG